MSGWVCNQRSGCLHVVISNQGNGCVQEFENSFARPMRSNRPSYIGLCVKLTMCSSVFEQQQTRCCCCCCCCCCWCGCCCCCVVLSLQCCCVVFVVVVVVIVVVVLLCYCCVVIRQSCLNFVVLYAVVSHAESFAAHVFFVWPWLTGACPSVLRMPPVGGPFIPFIPVRFPQTDWD